MPRFLLVYCTIPLMLALWFLSAVATAAETIHETDFGTATVPVNHALEGTRKGSFVGVLPPSWSEDFTAWSTSVATAKLASEGERAHLQLSIESGFSQFHTGLPDLVEGAHYRLSLQARNQASGPLTVGLRMRPAPYHFVWSCQVQSADRWVDRSWCFALSQKPSQRLGIFLVAGGVGQVDVRGVRLERLTDAEVAALIQRPSPTLRNLFRNSRFPLGLQSGWNLNRACDSEMASADPERIGPSGAPALRLAAATRCILYSEPFCVADATRKNRVALSFTGTGTWHMAMLQGGREIATKNLTPKAEWQREGLDFSPDPAARAFALRISGTGTLWIDGLSAHAGTENRPYESAGVCEVALAPTSSEIAETRIQFVGDPTTITYAVTGPHRDAILKSTVTDIHGTVKALPDIHLADDGFSASGSIDFGAFRQAPLGQFRIEAWVEREGVRISPFNELVITCLRRPLFWGKDAPDSPFGGHALSVDRTLRILKAGGINWARLHDAGTTYIGWHWLEPEPGVWKFFDEDIARYRNNHLKLYAQLGTSPKWASHASKYEVSGYFSVWFQPLSLEPYANYVKTVVTRYAGVIEDWFVWNEPYNVGWWAVAYDKNHKPNDGYITSEHPQADYVKLAHVAYQTAKATNPRVKVTGFSIPGSGGAWTQGLVDAGGLASTDIIDYHHYSSQPAGFPGDFTEREFASATAYLIEKTGPLTKPVYMGEGQGVGEGRETGVASTDYAGIYRHSLPYTSEDDSIRMANQTAAYITSLLAQKVTRLFLYSSHCYQNLGTSAFNNTLLCNDGYPHPSLAAHSNLAWHLEGRKHVKTVELAKGVFAYLFQADDGSVAVLSGKVGHQPFVVPESAQYEVRELFGNLLPARTPVTNTLIYVKSTQSAEQLEQTLSGR